MEHTFANQPSTRVFSGPGATTSPLLSLSPRLNNPRLLRCLLVPLELLPPQDYRTTLRLGWDRCQPPYNKPWLTRSSCSCRPSTVGSGIGVGPGISEMEAAPPRRSTRVSRKRAPVAAAAAKPSEDVKEPATKKRRGNLKKPPPAAKKDDSEDDNKPEGEEGSPSCCICMDTPEAADLANINGCDHLYCFDCIEKWAERENTCPQCKVRFTKIDRVNKARRRGAPTKNTKRVKQKDQRSDLAPGAALEGLLASFASSANFPPTGLPVSSFPGWEEILSCSQDRPASAEGPMELLPRRERAALMTR